MNFNTKGLSGDSLDKAKERDFVGYGIHKLSVQGHAIQEASTGTKKVTLFFETPKVTSEGFKPKEEAKWGGKVGKAFFSSWLKTDEQKEEFMKRCVLVAERFGVRTELDALGATTLDDFMTGWVKLVGGPNKIGYWKLCGEQYPKKDGGIGTVNNVSRFTFFKAEDQVASIENNATGDIVRVDVKSKEDGAPMTFSMENEYDFKKLEDSEEESDQEVETSGTGDPLWQ